jgi:hypothetical protein
VLENVVDIWSSFLPNHLLARGVAEGFSGTLRIQQAQEIKSPSMVLTVGAGCAVVSAFDADDRRQALDFVTSGPLQPI